MSKAWLKDLEKKVHSASKTLRSLREENAALKARVGKLESQVGDSGRGEEWQQDRDEIRERVEKLAGHLAELLGEE